MDRGFRTNPAFRKSTLDYVFLDLLNGHGRLVDTEHARCFARGRADTPGELWKVIGGVKLTDGLLPASLVYKVIPVGDEIVDRTTGVTEGNAAIHAARGLFAQFWLMKIRIDLEPIIHPLRCWPPRRKFARIIEEAGDLTHVAPRRLPRLVVEHNVAVMGVDSALVLDLVGRL